MHTGEFQVAQAGHPPPIVLDANGEGQLIGEGGFPIGWMPEIDFDNVSSRLNKGGRLILYTDGISECTNTSGEMYSGERLLDYTRRTHHLSLKDAMDGIMDELHTWSNDRPFDDDLSMLAIERIL